MTAPLPDAKRCPVCGEVKAATAYYVRRDGTTSRLASYCRPCQSAYDAARIKARYRTDPAFREDVKRRAKAWKRANGQGGAAEVRGWYRHAAQRHVAALYAAGWRRCDIAAAVGCARATVSSWHAGRTAPTAGHLRRLRALALATEEGTIAPPRISQRAGRGRATIPDGGRGR